MGYHRAVVGISRLLFGGIINFLDCVGSGSEEEKEIESMRLKRMGLDIVDCISVWGMVSSRNPGCGDVLDGEGVMFEYVIAPVRPRLNQAAKLHHQLQSMIKPETRRDKAANGNCQVGSLFGEGKIGDLTDRLGS